jgi:hypothetical protein
VLVKPLESDKYSNSKVTIMTKLVLKKVAAPLYVEPRQQTFEERYPPQYKTQRQWNDRPNNRFGNNNARNGY